MHRPESPAKKHPTPQVHITGDTLVRTDTVAIEIAPGLAMPTSVPMGAPVTPVKLRVSTSSDTDELIDVVGTPVTSRSDLHAPSEAPLAPGACALAVVFHDECLRHEVPETVALELPARLSRCMAELTALAAGDLRTAIRLERAPPRIHERWVRAVHDSKYVADMKRRIAQTAAASEPLRVSQSQHAPVPDSEDEVAALKRAVTFAGDTFSGPGSWNAALRAAGAACWAVDEVLANPPRARAAFAAVRPPGHHAGRAGRTPGAPSQGFCLINNIAIATRYALLRYGLERVAVVDFDVHHGNGTEELLAYDDNCLFASVHAYDGDFYPTTGGADAPHAPNVLNVPLRIHTGSAEFRTAFTRVVARVDHFAPQLVLLSAGFDAHRLDPVAVAGGGLHLDFDDFRWLTAELRRVAARHGAPIVSVLEGGYDVSDRSNALARAMSVHVRELAGAPPASPSGGDGGRFMAAVKALPAKRDRSPNPRARSPMPPPPPTKPSPSPTAISKRRRRSRSPTSD